MKAIAVIGMNYGDEGKGHITNFFSGAKTLNIRFNGGSQAAHGVYLSDGRNHIFHHFGSGTLRGARTLLGNHFIVNPILFAEEYAALMEKTMLQKIFIDPRCRVTTHYDMLINSFSSTYHGKHDTCGLGINETVERSDYKQLRIGVRDLFDKSTDDLKSMLRMIGNEWVPFRLKELKLPGKEFKKFFHDKIKDPEKIIKSYLETVRFLKKESVMWPSDNLIDRFLAKEPGRQIVFEAAQGLLLDQSRREYFPYLTRSSTGLKNVFGMLRTVKSPLDMEVYLVTRTYLTRHGDGPMFNEFELPRYKIEELSNPENPYQGKMRYGDLDRKWYDKAINEIRESGKPPQCLTSWDYGVAVTCMDHHELNLKDWDRVKLYSEGPLESDIKIF